MVCRCCVLPVSSCARPPVRVCVLISSLYRTPVLMGTRPWDLFYLNHLYIVLGARTATCEFGEDTVQPMAGAQGGRSVRVVGSGAEGTWASLPALSPGGGSGARGARARYGTLCGLTGVWRVMGGRCCPLGLWAAPGGPSCQRGGRWPAVPRLQSAAAEAERALEAT